MEKKAKSLTQFFNGDVIFLFACLGFSVTMLISACYIKDPTDALVPRLFSILAVLFSLAAIGLRAASFFWGFKREKISLSGSIELPDGVETEGAMNIYGAMGLSVVYVVVAELLSFIVGTVVIVFAYLWFARYRRIVFGLIYSVIVAGVLYWLFYTLLKVNLPEGLIPWPWQRLIQ